MLPSELGRGSGVTCYFNTAICAPNRTCLAGSCVGDIPCITDTGCSGGIPTPGQEAGCVQDHAFFAAIARSFGGNGSPFGSCGFTFERAEQIFSGNTCSRNVKLGPTTNELVTYTGWTEGRWYRMKLEKTSSTGLKFTAWEHVGGSWQQIGMKTTTTTALGGSLSTGRVGFYGWQSGQEYMLT
jgi:hypothetical protein